MLESNKLPYYGLSLILLAGGFLVFLVYGFIYLIMNLSKSFAEIEAVKKKLLIGTYIVTAGVVIFFITLGMDYKHMFDARNI